MAEMLYILKCGAAACNRDPITEAVTSTYKAEEHLQRDREFHDPLEEAHKRPPFVNFKR
jgi:hypothetical protein